MKKLKTKLIVQLLLVIVLWVIGMSFGLNDVLELYGFLMLASLLPIIAIRFYRHKRKKEIGSLHKTFNFFVWFYIILTVMLLLTYFIDDYPYHLEWWSIEDLLYIVVPLTIMIAILFILRKINSSLMPINQKKENFLVVFVKNNKEISLAMLAIILVLVVSITILVNTQNTIDQLYDWGLSDVISGEQLDIYIQNLYTNMYKKITTFGSFIFASAFLLLYSFKKNS
jgi:hypothetical protein